MALVRILCRMALILFKLVSGGMDFKNFITALWSVPIASPLGFQLVTVNIFSSFSILSKYRSGLPSKVDMISISESFA